MARLTPHHGDQQPPTTWRELVDKWLHNPAILAALLTAFLALLTALVLITGLAGAGLATLIAATTLPATWKARPHAQHDHTNPDDQ